MKKFLCFNVKEPFEKVIDKILKANEEKSKIEFADTFLGSILNEKQLKKFVKWLEDNNGWLESKTSKENELERLQKGMPLGCTLELSTRIPIKTYFTFDFR